MRFLILAGLFLSLSSEAKKFIIGPKQSLKFDLTEDSSVWIEDSSVVKIKEFENYMQVTAKKSGVTHLDIDGQRHQIRVLPRTHYATYSALNSSRWLRKNSEFYFSTAKITVSVKMNNPQLFLQLLQDLPPLESDLRWRVQANSVAKSAIREHVSERLVESGLAPSNLYFAPHLTLALPSHLQKMRARYRRALSSWGIDVIVDPQMIETAPLIEIEIQIVEFKSGFIQKYGMQWPDRLSASLMPNPELLDSIAQLHASEAKGESKILASPKLLSRSGKKASFHSGGEIPILSGHLGREVNWKKHGIQLDFEPRVDLHGKLNLKIQTEVSSPDFSASVDGIPGFTTNRMSTDFTLTQPRTIMISGLIRKDQSHAQQGVPFVHRLPILGPLFGSQTTNDNSTQLAIFVHPKLLRDAPSSEIESGNPQ